MKSLSVQLNQQYKSFVSGFSCSLRGDLIILSGINGSGKSQLIDIISQRESHGNRKAISATISLDGQEITRNDILRRSFKENINVPELTHAGTESIASHKNNAWNAYNNYLLDYNNEHLWDYKESSERAKKILTEEHGEQKFNSKQIIQTEFKDALPPDYVWKSDDIFTNFIGELFFNYALDVYDAKAKAGETGEKFDPAVLPMPPWKQLNNLFAELRFEYRFKEDYYVKNLQINEQPCLYQVKNDEAVDENESRKLADLSDGEKAIISLSFASLSGVKHKDRKILLLDEFDANFNPSLTEVFYRILDKYFVLRGILIVIATHSPTTISLALENATFYEVFKKSTGSSRILPVQRNDYAELQIANKTFYDKISNQNVRIEELEKENSKLDRLGKASKPILVVEDKYDQIYKIAWLKLNDVVYNNDEDDIDQKFDERADFQIYGFESANSVAGLLRTNNADFYQDKKIVGLFDFDEEGSRQFYCLNKGKGWDDGILGDLNQGFYKKRDDHTCFYALLLPIPDILKNRITDIRKGKFTSFVAIENLLPENFLVDNDFCVKEKILDCEYLQVRDDKKNEIWRKLSDLEKDDFKNFEPLFSRIMTLFS